jgi:Predicted membrane protein
MSTKASISGHPIHAMLVAFPISLWTTSVAVDVFYYFMRNSALIIISRFLLAAGCIGAIAAAVFGIIDWLGLQDREVKRVANWHARLNIAALVIFSISFYLRMQRNGHIVGHHLTIPFLISFVGLVLIGISGWLGGELVYKHGVGVQPRNNDG